MASLKVILKLNKIKNGLAPVYLRIIKDRKAKFISTDIKIKPEDWNEASGIVKKSHPNSARMNAFIAQKVSEAQNTTLEMESKNPSVTSYLIKEKIQGKASLNFFDFSEKVLDSYENQNQFGTRDKSKAILNKIEKFNGSKNLIFPDITPRFLDGYATFCRSTFKNKTNTIHKDMKFIRKVVNDAVRLDLIEIKDNPFLKYKLTTEKTHRSFLSEGELSAIKDISCTPGTKMDLHRDMFVFAAYTGLRVSDILTLKRKDIDNTHIHFTIRKTGTQVSIKIPDVASALLDKYKPKKSCPDKYAFPALEDSLDENDFRLMDQKISSTTAYINKNLKLLAKKIELTKPLSFHISRHTFATRALTKGISIDKVSKLLGHSNVKETQIYAKIVNEELDKAMDMFN